MPGNKTIAQLDAAPAGALTSLFEIDDNNGHSYKLTGTQLLALIKANIGNVSITAAGLAPQAPNDATKFLNGQGAYSNPSATAGSSRTLAVQTAAVDSSNATMFTYTLPANTFAHDGDGFIWHLSFKSCLAGLTSSVFSFSFGGVSICDSDDTGTPQAQPFCAIAKGRNVLFWAMRTGANTLKTHWWRESDGDGNYKAVATDFTLPQILLFQSSAGDTKAILEFSSVIANLAP